MWPPVGGGILGAGTGKKGDIGGLTNVGESVHRTAGDAGCPRQLAHAQDRLLPKRPQ